MKASFAVPHKLFLFLFRTSFFYPSPSPPTLIYFSLIRHWENLKLNIINDFFKFCKTILNIKPIILQYLKILLIKLLELNFWEKFNFFFFSAFKFQPHWCPSKLTIPWHQPIFYQPTLVYLPTTLLQKRVFILHLLILFHPSHISLFSPTQTCAISEFELF